MKWRSWKKTWKICKQKWKSKKMYWDSWRKKKEKMKKRDSWSTNQKIKQVVITTMQSVCSNWPELLRMSEYILFCSNSIFFTNLISSHPTSKNLERSLQTSQTLLSLQTPQKFGTLSSYLTNLAFSPFTSKTWNALFKSQTLLFLHLPQKFCSICLSPPLSLFIS